MTDELIGPIPLETPKPVPADAIDSDAPAIERPRHRARTRFFVAFLISLLAGLALGAGALYAYDREYTGRVLPGVSVGGIDLSGLSPDAAAAKLHDAYDHFGEGQAVVVGRRVRDADRLRQDRSTRRTSTRWSPRRWPSAAPATPRSG